MQGSAPRRRLSSRAVRRVIRTPVGSIVERLESRMLLALTPAGAEFLVNTFTTGNQDAAAIGVDADGDFVVVWHSGQDGGVTGIYAQRYNAAGVAQGGEFRVNNYTTGIQAFPSIGMDAAGDFVVAWQSNGQDGSNYGIYAQRYNAAGVAQGGEFRVNSYTTGSQSRSAVGMDVTGDFVVAWDSNGQDGSSYGIYAQRYSATGTPQGSEFRVNSFISNTQAFPAIGVDAGGDFVIAWQSNGQDGSGYGIYAQRYNAAGVAQNSFRVNSHTTNHQALPAIGMDAAGNFVVAWCSFLQDGNSYGVYAQRYSAAGTPQGSESRVNSFTTNSQDSPAIGVDADGDFVIAWLSTLQDGSGNGVYAQRYNTAGVPQGTEFRINTYTTNDQETVAIAMDAAGDFVAVWTSDAQDGSSYGIYAQRYDESTDTAAPIITGSFVNGTPALPYSVVPGPAGQIVVAFSENVLDTGGPFSVTNPVNWRVTHHSGSGTANVPISTITYFFNAAANRFQATLELSTSFSSGNLQVIALDNIRDLAGNALDGNLDLAPGGKGVLTFAIGSPVPAGGEFRVNSYTTSYQTRSAIGMDADGDFVVAWASSSQEGSGYGIYAQRYDAAGAPQGTEFRVNSFTAGTQHFPAIGTDADGDFVVAWASFNQDGSNYGIYARRYNAAGVPQGTEFLVNTFTTGSQVVPAIRMATTGDFVVAWQSNTQDGSNYGVYARRFNAAGVPQGTEFRVNSYTTGSQQQPAIGIDADGAFVVVWDSVGQDGSSDGIYAQRYDSAGVAQGTEFRINSYTTNGQGIPEIGMDAAGNFVVTWASFLQDGSSNAVYARRYNAAGSAQGTEFLVNTFTTGTQSNPAIGMDVDGDFVVTWASYAQDGSSYGIYSQRYNAVGVAQGAEFRVNSFTTSGQNLPAIGTDADGDFVVVWNSNTQDGSNYGIYGQRFALGATPTVGSLSGSPDPVVSGSPFTLTATGVSDDMFAASVSFYREANGIAGLQFGIDGDTPLATDHIGGDGWSASVSSAGFAPGAYTYYAQATDNENLIGAPASIAHSVAMSVLASAFDFNAPPQKILFGFDANAAAAGLGLEDILLQKVGGGAVPGLTMLPYGTDGTNVASFTMNTQLADGNYRATISAAGVSGGGNPLAADYILDFFILGGDANHDRKVDVLDLVILGNNWLGTGKTWSQADFDGDGDVDQHDLGIMAVNWQQILATPAPALPVAPTSARAPARTPTRTPTRVIDLVV